MVSDKNPVDVYDLIYSWVLRAQSYLNHAIYQPSRRQYVAANLPNHIPHFYKHIYSHFAERHAPIDNCLHVPMTNHTLGKMHRTFLTEAPESVGRVWRQHIHLNIIYQSPRRHHAFLITYYILRRRPNTNIYRACIKHLLFNIIIQGVLHQHPDKILKLSECHTYIYPS